jgi:hypothetical protein
MKDIRELHRLASPAPKPQAIACEGPTLWMGSIATSRIYRIDRPTWTVKWETAAPGKPWGMAVVGSELRVVSGETEEDHRIIRRCLPWRGFDAKFGIPCPDGCGSQLGYDGGLLHLSQWYPRKVLALGPDGNVERVIPIPHGICGQVFAGGFIYLVTTDDEKTNDYWLTRVDVRMPEPGSVDLARIPFAARGLAFDGEQFWTNHRESDQIVSFALPD